MAKSKLSEIERWQQQIQHCQDYMRPRHRMWRDLLRRYGLEYPSDSLDRQHIIRKSSMYPITRQVRASVAFNYPRFNVTVEDNRYARAGEILTRACDKAVRLMRVKREVQQQTFDVLFCGIGWGKYHFNPAGVNAEPPYVSNDELHEDFVAYTRINPFHLFVDPWCPPHRLGDARFVLERLYVPMEFLEQDDRYDKRALGKLTRVGDTFETDFLADMEEAGGGPDEEEERRALARSLSDGEMVELWEVSDRLHGRRLTLSLGVDTFLENDLHPFLKARPVEETDAFGNTYTTGYEPTGGYLVRGGFAYSPLKIDGSGDGFYPVPSMEYIKDLEQMQIDGLSRRVDLTKRFRRNVLVSKAELTANPELGDQLEDAPDGALIAVTDLTAFAEIPWGNPPQDQLNLANEARQSEEEVLRVSEMSGIGRRTATEASFAASAGAINREWFKDKVAELYVEIATNTLRIFADQRYTPQSFIITAVADEGGPEEALLTLQQAHFLTTFHVDVDAETIQPMAAQRERDNVLALADRLLPHTDLVNRRAVLEKVAYALGERNPAALLNQAGSDATRQLILLENMLLAQGQDPGVLPGLDHMAHIQGHQEAEQQALQQINLPPNTTAPMVAQQQNVLRQGFEQHIAAHQQYLGTAAAALQGGGSAAAPGQAVPTTNDTITQVRSSAQNASNAAQAQAQEDIAS